MRIFLIIIFGILPFFGGIAQTTFPVNGVMDERTNLILLRGATIHKDAETVLQNADILIRKDKIEAIGQNLKAPEGCLTIELNGQHIYPSFIELYSNYGIDSKSFSNAKEGENYYTQYESDIKGAYGWNEAIRTEINAATNFQAQAEKAKELRKFGFGSLVTHLQDGIARGSGCLVSLGEKKENLTVLKADVAAFYSFNKGTSSQAYPSSLMGSIALLRQTFLDGQWYASQKSKEQINLSLENWNRLLSLPKIFVPGDKLSILRADKIAKEFNQKFIYKSNGDEYQRLDEIKALGAALIVPVNFPAAYDVTDPYDAYYLSLSSMKHWELAPTNLSMLEKAGVNFAITADGIKDLKDFLPNIRKAIKAGLTEKIALKALTIQPALMLNIQDMVGSLETGKLANFIVCSGNIFDEKTVIHQNWVQGQKFVINDFPVLDHSGKYDLTLSGDRKSYVFEAHKKEDDYKYQIIEKDTIMWDVNVKINESRVSINYYPNKDKKGELIRLSGWMEKDQWKGTGYNDKGEFIEWVIKNKRALDPAKKDSTAKKDSLNKKTLPSEEPKMGQVTYPFLAYGYESMPIQEDLLIKNVTVWTNEKDGIIQNVDVHIKNGKIAKVGKKLSINTAKTIDGTGRHLTPGIIDEHSHIAISRGVNEWTQASSAEVRIGDVVNSEDINIYRQLAAGVTAAQLLHGSANPIGGQSAMIKLRWGFSPEKMKIEGADGFIKFALGENVKQSNAGDFATTRFPQSRIGVEQVYMDHFTRAKEYGFATAAKSSLRRDLDIEAINEIINKKRFITCHSYVQSEINMLMKVAEQFDFRINTFTHILEGYKLADKMKAHGVTGSSFADWWMYKYEVMDAIPYNAAILNNVGVNTCINSDDAEMGRRLNTEAAKTVKYGGLTPEEALKTVTLNPAIALHLDKQMGSVKEGKDADLVLWSDYPLSVYAKPLKTFVDGYCFFDAEIDKKLQEDIRNERHRLIQKMISEKKGGGATQEVKDTPKQLWHCEDLGDYMHD